MWIFYDFVEQRELSLKKKNNEITKIQSKAYKNNYISKKCIEINTKENDVI